MSALMIATITVKDPGKFQDYIAKTKEISAPLGAELLYRGRVDRVLTGEAADHGLTIIVKFPSLEKIQAWHDSDAYRAIIPLRQEGADMKIVTYEVME